VHEFHEALYESELALYGIDKKITNGVVQEWDAFSGADVSLPVAQRLAGSATVLYLQDYRERSVIARVLPLAVTARAATGYAGSATFYFIIPFYTAWGRLKGFRSPSNFNFMGIC
jgi:hypothetical protein